MSKKVILINLTRNKILGPVKFADNFISRFKGLMFKNKLESGLVLKIPAGRGKRGSAIHMFFMRIPLDVIFLNENREVVDMASLEPWNMYTPLKPARYVIELEEGSIIKSSTQIGDFFDFQ